MCEEEVYPEQQYRTPSLIQEEPQPPHIKEEPEEEPLQRPDKADGSTFTFLAVKSEQDEGTQKIIKKWAWNFAHEEEPLPPFNFQIDLTVAL